MASTRYWEGAWLMQLDSVCELLAPPHPIITSSSSSQILKPPATYKPIHTPARKLTATPTPMGMSGFRFQMEDDKIKIVDDLQPVGAGKQELPYMKVEDAQYFSKLLEDVDEEALPPDEQKERKIMRLLLKIKNGTPPMRKVRWERCGEMGGMGDMG